MRPGQRGCQLLFQLQRLFQVRPSLRVSAKAQTPDAGIDQRHRFTALVARLPAVLEHRQVVPQARRLVAREEIVVWPEGRRLDPCFNSFSR